MQVSVQVTQGLERRMSVSIPTADVDNEVEQRIHDYAKQVRMDGFRPGKVPVKLVRKRYGAQLRQETLGELIDKHYRDALRQEGLTPAGQATIAPEADHEAEQRGEGEHFTFDVLFEVYPDIEIADLSEVEIERAVCDVTDADVDQRLEAMRRQRTRWDVAPRAAVEGDKVTADYAGYLDGEAVEQAAQQDAEVVLGDGRMLPDFEQGLAGVKADESVSFDVAFPEDYPGELVAGKTLNFQAQIKSVAEPTLPEVDAAFVKSFGVESGDPAQLRAQVRDSMAVEARRRLSQSNKEKVVQALLDHHEPLLPQALVTAEIQRLDEERRQRSQAPAPASAEALEAQARRHVRLALLMRHIVEANGIKLDQELLNERLRAFAATFGDPEIVMNLYRSNAKWAEGMESATLEDQVVEWVYGQAKVKAVPRGFDELAD